MSLNKNQSLSVFNSLFLMLVLIMNGLANGLPINNKTTGELSAQYPNLFVPAGFTFSIWGILYLSLIIFVVYQNIQAFSKNRDDGFIPSIGLWFIVSCLANSSWILAWHFEKTIISLLIMIILFFSLLKIYLNLKIGRSSVSTELKWIVFVPFSVYLGWITVATLANTTAVLVDINWSGWGLSENLWTIIVILLSTGITMTMIFRRSDIYFAMVILWAFTGILWKRINDHSVNDSLIEIILVIVMVTIVISSLTSIILKRNY